MIKLNYDDNCIPVIDVIQDKYQHIFQYEKFNHMQSIVLGQILNSDNNMVIAAPTGSGKTVCHELSIIRLLMKSNFPEKSITCVFIAPNKALCQQRVMSWTKFFFPLGLKVIEVTGDSENNQSLSLIAKSNIIITTPEKWDALTRSWRKHIFLLGRIDLLLIDEVHHIHEDRGAILEIVCVRMRTLSQAYKLRTPEKNDQTNLRIVALSATLPNVSDIGEWLNCSHENVHFFDDTFRPVPLDLHVLGYNNMGNPFLFEKSLDDKVIDVLNRFSDKKQTLIFCATKKTTEALCKLLASNMKPQLKPIGFNKFYDENLQSLVSKGFAYHHAGIPPDDRSLIEELFIKGDIQILCATSTLAHGVNLPAHLVIVKGTNQWRGGSKGYEKLSRSMVTQMIGRAGRPGFDDKGIAVIMTSKDDKYFYENAVNQNEVVESNILGYLTEALCAEITQTVIEDISDAISWLKNTFFYIRVRKNPEKYGFLISQNIQELEEKLKDLCMKSINDLTSASIIAFDEMGYLINPLPEAFIMSKHLIKFESMITIMNIPTFSSLEEVLLNISQTQETQKVVKRNEKVVLNNLWKEVRFSKNLKIKDACQKTFVLLQAAIERKQIKDFSMRVEQSDIVEQSLRILSAIHDYSIEKEKGKLLESCIYINRSLHYQMWETGYDSMLSQLPGLNANLKQTLIDNNLSTIEALYSITQSKLQQMTKCSVTDSQKMINFSKLCMANKSCLSIDLDEKSSRVKIKSEPVNTDPIFNSQSNVSFNLVCYENLTGKLICFRKISSGKDVTEILIDIPDKISTLDIHGSLISEYIGLDFIKLSSNELADKSTITSSKKHSESSTVSSEKAPVKRVVAKLNSNDKKDYGMFGIQNNSIPAQEKEIVFECTNMDSSFFDNVKNRKRDSGSDIIEKKSPYETIDKTKNKLNEFKPNPKRNCSSLDLLRSKSDELNLDNINLKKIKKFPSLGLPNTYYSKNSNISFEDCEISQEDSKDNTDTLRFEISSDFNNLADKHAMELEILLTKQKEEREEKSFKKGILSSVKSQNFDSTIQYVDDSSYLPVISPNQIVPLNLTKIDNNYDNNINKPFQNKFFRIQKANDQNFKLLEKGNDSINKSSYTKNYNFDTKKAQPTINLKANVPTMLSREELFESGFF